MVGAIVGVCLCSLFGYYSFKLFKLSKSAAGHSSDVDYRGRGSFRGSIDMGSIYKQNSVTSKTKSTINPLKELAERNNMDSRGSFRGSIDMGMIYEENAVSKITPLGTNMLRESAERNNMDSRGSFRGSIDMGMIYEENAVSKITPLGTNMLRESGENV